MIPYLVMSGLSVVVTLAATLLAMPLVRRMLVRFQVLDHASSRSLHSLSTPRGAGLAELVGILAGLTSVLALSWVAIISLTGFTFLGAWDDWKSLSPRVRLVAQLLLAGSVVCAMVLSDIPNSSWQVILALSGILIFPLIINTVNFMDGLNGMSATHGIVFGVTYAVLTWQVGASTWTLLGLCLAAASAAFLPWNFRKTALLFLGDSGSYLLGAIVALLILVCWVQGTPLMIALAPLAIYLSDVCVTLARRKLAGKPLLEAHREHAYQALPARGWDHRKASMIVLTCSSICCTLALIAQARIISLYLLGMLITLVVMAYFVTIRKLSKN